ncbi:hypothetical protein A2886_03215 [candidate division WWE3 bacterium RIFCSPHIGHO2_01_FULL_42_13]|uniref:Uncharacterized protein n=1 Tax=candidate division WWE3 bacterium RIFCSPHIGHO2_01_FULL_42_13 TaxID=1802617 RepID=A0A1F4UR33_UNCKA|nr:MAG: hypothetical protein A2886_03215 [candidate division WWE3 bacterium RIFCSPHIGHO2_01_FULL_42_13]
MFSLNILFMVLLFWAKNKLRAWTTAFSGKLVLYCLNSIAVIISSIVEFVNPIVEVPNYLSCGVLAVREAKKKSQTESDSFFAQRGLDKAEHPFMQIVALHTTKVDSKIVVFVVDANAGTDLVF